MGVIQLNSVMRKILYFLIGPVISSALCFGGLFLMTQDLSLCLDFLPIALAANLLVSAVLRTLQKREPVEVNLNLNLGISKRTKSPSCGNPEGDIVSDLKISDGSGIGPEKE